MVVDMEGNEFYKNCKVARAISDGYLLICEVTRMENGKIYLDNSKVPIKYPRRLLIVKQDPLHRMIKNHTPAE